jgi:hypothetical protein
VIRHGMRGRLLSSVGTASNFRTTLRDSEFVHLPKTVFFPSRNGAAAQVM